MDQFLTSIQKSIAERNWHAALYMCLTLPDVCSRLESEDDKTNGMRYAAWFNRYMGHLYTRSLSGETVKFMSGDDCYVLRCSMLHEGISEVSHQRKKGVLDRFFFSVMPQHCILVDGNVLQLNVAIFCGEIASAVKTWQSEFLLNHTDKRHKLDDLVVVHENSFQVNGINFSTNPFGSGGWI